MTRVLRVLRHPFRDPDRSCRYCGHPAEPHTHNHRATYCSATVRTGRHREARICDCARLDQRREWWVTVTRAARTVLDGAGYFVVGLAVRAVRGPQCVTCGAARDLPSLDNCLGCVIDGHARTVLDVVDR